MSRSTATSPRLLSRSVFFLLTSLAAGSLNAEPAERGWTLSPVLGVLWGEAREIVHYDDDLAFPNQNDYLSLLRWDLKNIPTAGLDLRWENGRRLGISVSFDSAIPGIPAGEMDDYDWVYTNRDWSHWSQSDIRLRWGFMVDVAADRRIADVRGSSFHLGAAYHLDSWAWTDKIKDSVYTTSDPFPYDNYPVPWTTGNLFRDTDIAGEYGKNGIDYEVAYHSLLFTMEWKYRGKVLFGGLTGRIGPALAIALDYHKLHGLQFWDIGFGGPWIDGTFQMGFRTGGRFSMTLRGDIAWLVETRGTTYMYDIYGNLLGVAAGGGGFGFFRSGLSLSFSWTLDPLHPLGSP